jgi:DNA-binding NarL/FixJ family response regulator
MRQPRRQPPYRFKLADQHSGSRRVGASGIFLKSEPPDRLVQAIRLVRDGGIWVVLMGIVGGLSNRKIGENMGLLESSVKNFVQHLFSKAGVRTRSQLVRAALEGLLGPAHENDQTRSTEIFT